MFDKILIRYGELVLKKKNRKTFINHLSNNIKHIVGMAPEVEYDRMYLPYSQENMENLQYVFGLSSYSPVKVIKHDLDEIKSTVLLLIEKEAKTFKVAARRNYKKFPIQSSDLNNILGGHILKNSHLKVDVHTPDQTFYVEIRNKDTYVFANYYKGLGGLPVGSSGKVLHLMSGGIDSPVAAFMLMKRGLKVDYLSFITPPQTDEKTVNKIKRLSGTLNKYQITSILNLGNYSKLMNYLAMTSNQAYKITLMRRSFYRIAQKVAQKHNYLALSNGDNLGQVASQTLESLSTIGYSTNMQIFRPLLCFDKEETIKIAKKIDTYDISIEKANETCELFAPKEPVTRPNLEIVMALEAELDLLETLENELVESLIESTKLSIKE
ncbi:tRNA uracil 4-sulfurtransferase ThiI [Mycoplasmopsis alligatoris]|uniref:Probable tRNA sulfurtransferase n=1 Tax=Mycoplasmopsis alligatoris A21JP2 TaxID=747682 RepID=D4XWY1_9BACT|nr:tRNA uracil 4-sulfurtransferase ThiI [Mycoplasmopsis alligatoris]EFF41317.1 thiamine biosynthesis/tRNA modification protein ThiI [Mycoplasmopsis alligatoris A21JP2]